ncbi:MAG: glycine--tRNA ligase subunit beta, partial [Alphaproteobacteria bacterium]|nr:glycine--tRNA ligase subunit beta [Alphaproteobacteria bacterium]
ALGVIRLVLENDLRLRLDTYFDKALLRHKAALNKDEADAADLQAVEDLINEIAERGVFGAALRTVQETLREKNGDDAAKSTLLDELATVVPDKSADLLAFFHDRLKVYLRDRGIRHDVIDACLAMPASDDLAQLVKRANALTATLATEDGQNLIQGFRRANNILTQAEEKDGVEYSYGADVKFAETDEERALFAALDSAEAAIGPAMEAEDFTAAMHAMAGLRAPIDAFFETVQVNAESEVLRRNRLNLLHRIRETCGSVADLTRLEE